MILVYFIVLQTFFQGRKNLRSKLDSFDDQFQLDDEIQEISDENRLSMKSREDSLIMNEVFRGDINKLDKNDLKSLKDEKVI